MNDLFGSANLKPAKSLAEFENRLIELLSKNPEDWKQEDILDFPEEICKPITIKIEGKDFDSTISSSFMASMLHLQQLIEDVYSVALYNEKRKLKPEEKKEVELYLVVQPGCTEYVLKIIELFKKVVNKMTPKQAIFTICVLAGGFFVTSITNNYITSNARIQEVLIQQQKENEIVSQLCDLNKVQLEYSSELFSTLADINGSVQIDGKEYDKEELKIISYEKKEQANRINEQNNSEMDIRIISGDFVVKKIENLLDQKNKIKKRKVTIKDTKNNLLYTCELEGDIGEKIFKHLESALDATPINLTLIIVIDKNDKVLQTRITRCGDELFPEEYEGQLELF